MVVGKAKIMSYEEIQQEIERLEKAEATKEAVVDAREKTGLGAGRKAKVTRRRDRGSSS